jgi:hypothetical protein
VSSPGSKNISLGISGNQNYRNPVSCPPEGRIAIVTTRWARDAMDAAVQRRMGLLRTVKSCGPGAAYAGEKLAASVLPMTVTTSSLHREEHEVSRKAIAQGMSVCSPLTCMLVCRHSCALWHMRPRVQRAPGIPCALSSEGGTTNLEKLGQNMSRERARMFPRRCEPTGRANARPMTGSAKQSICPLAARWIASSQGLLAMTAEPKTSDRPVWTATPFPADMRRIDAIRPGPSTPATTAQPWRKPQ